VLELSESRDRRIEYLTSAKQTDFSPDDHLWAETLEVPPKKLKDDEREKQIKEMRKQFDSDISDTEAYMDDAIDRGHHFSAIARQEAHARYGQLGRNGPQAASGDRRFLVELRQQSLDPPLGLRAVAGPDGEDDLGALVFLQQPGDQLHTQKARAAGEQDGVAHSGAPMA